MNELYEKLMQEQESWFEIWFSKKRESEYLFPSEHKEWLKLAFRAGFNVGRVIPVE